MTVIILINILLELWDYVSLCGIVEFIEKTGSTNTFRSFV